MTPNDRMAPQDSPALPTPLDDLLFHKVDGASEKAFQASFKPRKDDPASAGCSGSVRTVRLRHPRGRPAPTLPVNRGLKGTGLTR